MQPRRFDAIVVGTGQAGPALAQALAAAGRSVAVIERGAFGGTCVNNGCTPTKAMVASAYAAHMARRAADYGVEIAGEVRVDMRKVKARKDAIVGKSTQGVEKWMRSTQGVTVIQGHARFTGPHAIAVGDAALEAELVFLDVGGRSARPSDAQAGGVPYLTSETVMDVDFLPEHLLVVGGSYVGLEFGQMFRRFGSRVTIVEMGPRLIAREDEDVSQAVREILEAEGIDIRTHAKCIGLERKGDRASMSLDCSEGAPRLEGTHVLWAAGRKPNTDDLGLDRAAIATDARGNITVGEDLQTNVRGVYAPGDCNGRGAFTHTSYNDFEIVAANLLDGEHRKVSDRITAYALYTDPPLGRAGMTEADVRRSGRRALIGKIAMEDVSRAFEKGETDGFMKILVDADTKQILGASFLGTSGDEAIHCVLDLMYAKAPYTVFQRAVHIHPTVCEFI
ncbi:MAG TPA: FAD-containing oxidoreductase, partial [Usitatibacter sp.]|nr:FAD-containing oxidoreductase [Usitatibacter sp.]